MPPLVSIAVMVTFGLPRKLIVLYSLASLGGINVFGRYIDWVLIGIPVGVYVFFRIIGRDARANLVATPSKDLEVVFSRPFCEYVYDQIEV